MKWYEAPLFPDHEEPKKEPKKETKANVNAVYEAIDCKVRKLTIYEKTKHGCNYCADAYRYRPGLRGYTKYNLTPNNIIPCLSVNTKDGESDIVNFCPYLEGCPYQDLYDEYGGDYASYDRAVKKNQIEALKQMGVKI